MHRDPRRGRDRLRIVVSGMVAGVPGHGGATWAVMQWVLGLRALGHRVLVVEPVDTVTADHHAYLVEFDDVFDPADGIALLTPDRRTVGADLHDVLAFCDHADVLINVAGMLRDTEITERIPRRAYLDLDPAFTQLWHRQGIDMGLAGHHAHVTVGLCIGTAECGVPTCGVPWITTPPPVHLPAWPIATGRPRFGVTTVANWRSYGSVEHRGLHHGQKVHSWRALVDVARRSVVPCEPALAIHPDEGGDIAVLDDAGWHVIDPAAVASTPRAYRDFVGDSTAELCIAKSGYVVSRSGWFSDRSACYLAAGRPVIAQETGFSRYLPSHAGLLSFDGVDDAVDAIDRVATDYRRHQRAAREVAQTHLRADVVLPRVLTGVLDASPSIPAPSIPPPDPHEARSAPR